MCALCSINSQGRGIYKYYCCLGWLALPPSLLNAHPLTSSSR